MRIFLTWLWLISVVPVAVYHWSDRGYGKVGEDGLPNGRQARREIAWMKYTELKAMQIDWEAFLERRDAIFVTHERLIANETKPEKEGDKPKPLSKELSKLIAEDKEALVAESRELAPDWVAIMSGYQELIDELLPADEDFEVICQIRLAIAKAQQDSLDIGGSIVTLNELLSDVADEFGENATITRAVRESLGKSNYLAARFLKEAQAAEDDWLPYAERARQVFRYLAEHEDLSAHRRYSRQVDSNFYEMKAGKKLKLSKVQEERARRAKVAENAKSESQGSTPAEKQRNTANER